MTVANNSSGITSVVPTGLLITREAVPGLAKHLANELYNLTTYEPYKYLPIDAGKKALAETIANYLHIMLTHMNVDRNYCDICGKGQAAHDRIGGWCPSSSGIPGGTKFTRSNEQASATAQEEK